MAETDRTAAGNNGQAAAPKRREELDTILQRIAEHIAEVDRQQEPAVRAGAPSAGAIGSERLSLRQPGATVASTLDKAPAMTPGQPDDVTTEPMPMSPETAGPSPRLRTATSEPPALRSALRQPQTATVPPRRVALRETPPSAQAAPSTPLLATDDAGSDPWDSQAIEALTSAYDSETAAAPLRNALDAMARPAVEATSPRRSEPPNPIPAVPPAGLIDIPASLAIGSDGPVAQARMAEIAQRVEAALDRLAPRELVAALGQRFDGLELQVADTHRQLARLDGIESSLNGLGEKLTDEHIVALFGSLVPTADELAQFAEDAAGRAADRVLEAYSQEMSIRRPDGPVKDPGTSLEIKAMRELIGAYMDDRRRSDAGTQEALETLQLAMQHLLDRVEPGDLAPEPVPHAALAAAPAASHPHAAIPAPVRPAAAAFAAPQPVSSEPDVSHYHYDPERDPLGAHQPQDLDAVPHAHSNEEANRAPHHTPASHAAASHAAASPASQPTQHLPYQAPEFAAALSPTNEPRPAAAGNDRQAFIALARKAAEKAKAEAEAKAPGEPSSKARGFRSQVLGGVAGPPTAGIRPSVLIIAGLAVCLLAGYWFVAAPKLGSSGSASAVVRQQAPAEAREAPDRASTRQQPDVEPDEPVRTAPARGGQLPAKPSKTSDEGQPAITDRPVEEARIIEGPIDGALNPGTLTPGALGIAVALGDTPVTGDALMRARNQQHLASLSHRASFTAAEQHAASATSATGPDAPADASAAPVTAEATRLELPPAALGPLSLRVAAAKGDASAQLEIATRYAEGKGVKQSFPEAVSWYQRAAMQGLAVAQYRLATLQERGMGLKADPGRARVWYQRAAEQGNLKAMHNLAVMSASPAAGTPDYDTAARLFTDAAERGLADSQYNLAILAESGLGMQKDLVAAYKWYSLAAKAGDHDAQRRRDQLIARLTPDMIQAGDKQLATWRAGPANRFANDARVAAEAWKQNAAAAAAAPPTRR